MRPVLQAAAFSLAAMLCSFAGAQDVVKGPKGEQIPGPQCSAPSSGIRPRREPAHLTNMPRGWRMFDIGAASGAQGSASIPHNLTNPNFSGRSPSFVSRR